MGNAIPLVCPLKHTVSHSWGREEHLVSKPLWKQSQEDQGASLGRRLSACRPRSPCL